MLAYIGPVLSKTQPTQNTVTGVWQTETEKTFVGLRRTSSVVFVVVVICIACMAYVLCIVIVVCSCTTNRLYRASSCSAYYSYAWSAGVFSTTVATLQYLHDIRTHSMRALAHRSIACTCVDWDDVNLWTKVSARNSNQFAVVSIHETITLKLIRPLGNY